jgi:hypothetical protein
MKEVWKLFLRDMQRDIAPCPLVTKRPGIDLHQRDRSGLNTFDKVAKKTPL